MKLEDLLGDYGCARVDRLGGMAFIAPLWIVKTPAEIAYDNMRRAGYRSGGRRGMKKRWQPK